MPAHRSYRFYFMGHDGHVANSFEANCPGDEQACSRAIQAFKAQDRDHSIEVWDRARIVFRYP